jgi:hypothetical protein
MLSATFVGAYSRGSRRDPIDHRPGQKPAGDTDTGTDTEKNLSVKTRLKCWCRKRDSNPRPHHYE